MKWMICSLTGAVPTVALGSAFFLFFLVPTGGVYRFCRRNSAQGSRSVSWRHAGALMVFGPVAFKNAMPIDAAGAKRLWPESAR